MSRELVQFLRDRLAEDEQAARRAGDSFRQIGETGVIVATDGDRAEECASANWSGIAEHIVRHDPARVLREVAAKRELLADYERFVAERRRMMGGWDSYPETSPVLTAFAAVYADHPDYKNEWAA